MADNLDDGEFWLPSQFLSDTEEADFDILTPTTNSTNGFSSDLGSPVESVTETESDEDDFFDELTLQMARDSLLQVSNNAVKSNVLASSGSPQSILSPVGGGQTQGGRPVSPPPVPAKADYFKVGDGASPGFLQNTWTGKPPKGTGYFDSSRGLACLPKQHTSGSNQQLQAFQFQQLWSKEMLMRQEESNGGAAMPSQSKPSLNVVSRYGGLGRSNIIHDNRPLGLSQSAWPPLQNASNRRCLHPQPPTSGMRAVFPGKLAATQRESTGTGVFLPRMVQPTEPRNNTTKSGCSTVLVPERVVQALKNINAQSRCEPCLDSNVRFGGEKNGPSENASSESGGVNPEIQLPSEWTY